MSLPLYRSYKFKIDLYRYNLVVVVVPKACDYLKALKKQVSLKSMFESEEEYVNLANSAAFFLAQDDDVCYIFISGESSIGDVSHESTHAACHILSSRGVEESYTNDEPLAYLVSHIADMVYYSVKKFTKRKIVYAK